MYVTRTVPVTTEMTVMSVTPTVSATVVVADRFGLRRELSTASLPGTPKILAGTHPANADSGLTITGPRTSTARKTSEQPAMTTTRAVSPGFMDIPATVVPTPATRNSPAKTIRTSPVLKVCSSACARSAAIGATRVAARAGSSAATTVTVRPMTRPRTMVRGARVTAASKGIGASNIASTASAPAPRP